MLHACANYRLRAAFRPQLCYPLGQRLRRNAGMPPVGCDINVHLVAAIPRRQPQLPDRLPIHFDDPNECCGISKGSSEPGFVNGM